MKRFPFFDLIVFVSLANDSFNKREALDRFCASVVSAIVQDEAVLIISSQVF